jgi:hypothetical protein
MSLLKSLALNQTFDSNSEIVEFIKQLETENIYLRRGHCESISSYNNDRRNQIVLDEKLEFKRIQYTCPHFGTQKSRSVKGLRLNQNVMPNNCPVQIRFVLNSVSEKFEIKTLELKHKYHPVSAEHVKTYARKR